MARFYRKLAVLAKIETVEGTDAVPTGAANAIQMNNVTITPLAGDQVSRDLLLPYLGQQGVILTGTYATLSGQVEIAGAGAAGDVPGYGVLLRMCGLAETITPDTDVQYDPISGAFEAGTLYFNHDGVRHILLGAKGNVSANLTPKQIPHFTFTLTGLLGTISDTALPSVDYTAFQVPVPVNKANTTLSLLGAAAVAESVAIDLGNQIEPRFLIGAESIQLVDRNPSGTCVVEARLLATTNWFAAAQARTRGALAAQHGTIAGNIVKFDAPAVEIGRPTEGQTQKIINYSLPLMLCTDAGDDELKITVK
ncbi:phage tail tube protein [Mesorhizobium sp. WSM3626]|uniref:phage tail tube protein n=1 Tax=Mesorhizobium sp. WSM3626 TaxID=1040987 RepID=UPI00048292B5|nr:phage tail tube protein [Mesorhizobium sp. WSM3626]